MELRQLRYFVNAATTENFTEAAALSFISQSTLSQQIRQLENDLGSPLFQRLGKRVLLTEAGRAFLPFAERTLHDAEDGRQRLRDIENLVDGELRIGVTYGLSPLLTHVLQRYCEQYPKVNIKIVYRRADELIELTRNNTVDISLTFNLLHPDEAIEEHQLFTTRLLAAVSVRHPLARKTSLTPDDLRRYPLVLPSRGVNARRQFDDYLHSQGLQIKPQVEINEIYTMLQMVKTGSWIAAVAESLIHEAEGIVGLPFSSYDIPMHATMMTLRGAYQRNAVKRFEEALRL